MLKAITNIISLLKKVISISEQIIELFTPNTNQYAL